MSRGSLDDRRYLKEKERVREGGDRMERGGGEKLHESFSHLKDSQEDLRSKSLYFTEFNGEEPRK